ncbi:hypothetical protein Thiosp_03358 [Thiorhodovibrio litoralis]|uniref:hypothetical protein n=2 Tax=Thiorhodovibrio TaxID=61593 RepID=UPI0019122FEF|nr:hypothetical protein [Thiorhodovibrio winogradskyi]MBK5971315.1 hypothetical protein [Thiorhodovibrio winogradskyi]WPL13551.1 hypothetical protein Thiosp_03358 [Thiorhodovibrio litoralis]
MNPTGYLFIRFNHHGDTQPAHGRVEDIKDPDDSVASRKPRRMSIKHGIQAILMAYLLSTGPVFAQDAACHWIRLTGLEVGQTADFLSWGDYLPLIALEPGEFYSLLHGTEPSVELAAGRQHVIDGHWYYVPEHLINVGTMTLRFMLLDRDQGTDDDLVLPMRSHVVRLDQSFSKSGPLQFEIPELFVVDDQLKKSNAMRFRFELRRVPGHCGSGADAAAENTRYRRENRVHHLRTRTFSYFDDPVIAGRETKLFVDEKTTDAAAAFEIARRNLHELLTLGREIERLEGTQGFDELRFEFARLIATLKERRLQFSRVEQDGDERTTVWVSVPALASEPEWKQVLTDAVIESIPASWQVD